MGSAVKATFVCASASSPVYWMSQIDAKYDSMYFTIEKMVHKTVKLALFNIEKQVFSAV